MQDADPSATVARACDERDAALGFADLCARGAILRARDADAALVLGRFADICAMLVYSVAPRGPLFAVDAVGVAILGSGFVVTWPRDRALTERVLGPALLAPLRILRADPHTRPLLAAYACPEDDEGARRWFLAWFETVYPVASPRASYVWEALVRIISYAMDADACVADAARRHEGVAGWTHPPRRFWAASLMPDEKSNGAARDAVARALGKGCRVPGEPRSAKERREGLKEFLADFEAECASRKRLPYFLNSEGLFKVDHRGARDALETFYRAVPAEEIEEPDVLPDTRPGDPRESVERADRARRVREAVAKRRALTKPGSGRRIVLDNIADALCDRGLSLEELAEKTRKSLGALSEARSKEFEALARLLRHVG